MSDLLPRYVIGFLFGAVLAFLLSDILTTAMVSWAVFIVPLSFIVNEFIGRWGFGNQWYGYRFSSFALYAGVSISVYLGLLFASGVFGEMMILLGSFLT